MFFSALAVFAKQFICNRYLYEFFYHSLSPNKSGRSMFRLLEYQFQDYNHLFSRSEAIDLHGHFVVGFLLLRLMSAKD